MATARAHFGASLTYETCAGDLSALADESRAIAVLTLAEACAPVDGMAVFARLPVSGTTTCLCYGAQIDEDPIAAGGVWCAAPRPLTVTMFYLPAMIMCWSKPACLKVMPFGGVT